MPIANRTKFDSDGFAGPFGWNDSCQGRVEEIGTRDGRGKREAKAVFRRTAPGRGDVRRHLMGVGPAISVLLVDKGGKVKCSCIDIDAYEDGLPERIEAEVRQRCWPALVSRSKSGGAHVWFFFGRRVSMKKLRPHLVAAAAALGHANAEIYPKQDRPTDEGTGNLITLPYHGDTRRGIFAGQPVPPMRWAELAGDHATTLAAVADLDFGTRALADWQPCIEAKMADGAPEGERNDWLLQYAINAKRAAHGDPERLAAFLSEGNAGYFDPPLPEKEVRAILRGVAAKDYRPDCGGILKPFCNRSECLKRRFGLRPEGSGGPIDRLVKYDYRPRPIWHAFVGDRKLEIDEAGALLKQADFARLCLVQLNTLPEKMKAADWDDHIRDVLGTIELVQPGGPGDAYGQLRTYLGEFLRLRGTDVPDAVEEGLVFEDAGVSRLRLQSFLEFLRRQGFRELRPERVQQLIEELG